MVLMPFLNYAMHPDQEHTVCVDPTLLKDEEEQVYKTEADPARPK